MDISLRNSCLIHLHECNVIQTFMPDTQHKKLKEVILHLQQIYSTIIVSVAALEQQASDLDVDIATVLRRGAADKIQDQIEVIERILRCVE
jgi:hypothetical protein